MVASRRSVALLAGIVLAGCATSDPDGLGQSESTVAVSAEQGPAEPGSVAGERCVTIEQLSDPTIDIDLSEYTGVDLGTDRPPADLAFCDAVAGAPGRGLDSPAVYLPPGDHALANAVQNTAAGGGSFADERAIAKKALEDAGCTEDEIERALREVDRYFKDVLDAENSTQWVRPVNRP